MVQMPSSNIGEAAIHLQVVPTTDVQDSFGANQLQFHGLADIKQTCHKRPAQQPRWPTQWHFPPAYTELSGNLFRLVHELADGSGLSDLKDNANDI